MLEKEIIPETETLLEVMFMKRMMIIRDINDARDDDNS